MAYVIKLYDVEAKKPIRWAEEQSQYRARCVAQDWAREYLDQVAEPYFDLSKHPEWAAFSTFHRNVVGCSDETYAVIIQRILQ